VLPPSPCLYLAAFPLPYPLILIPILLYSSIHRGNSSGRRRCPECHGHGQVSCPVCRAAGEIKTYVQLTVRWCNHSDDHVVESMNMPGGVVSDAQGTLLFEEDHALVRGLADPPRPPPSPAAGGPPPPVASFRSRTCTHMHVLIHTKTQIHKRTHKHMHTY